MKKQRNCVPGIWTLIVAVLLFAMTLMGVALLEANRAQSDEHRVLGDVFLVRRLWSKFAAATNASDGAVAATVERIARDAMNASRTAATGGSNNYYEEQQAVVVKEENAPPAMAERIDSFGPPQGRSYEMDSSYDAADDYGGERFDSAEEADEGRAAQGRPQDSYYAPWQYATQTTAPPGSNNRKLQPAGNRPPYAAYDEVYDYPMGFQPRPQEQPVSKQAVSAPPAHAVAYAPASTESSLVTFLKTLKQMWDLYQAVISAWNSVAERHQQSTEQLKKERQEKQRLRQQQQQQQQANKSRINSKKPQRGNGNKDAKPNQNKRVKTTTTTTTTSTSSSSSSSNSDEAEEATTTSVAIVNAVKANATADAAQESSVRGMRHKREPEAASTDVGEGRYIKGDPLKGYYDFVITEGSYKFWAAFQVGTALLIIYSTFAAIYYSKVNPLTSDYDYQDYLGAGRSMTGGDDDFVDDSEPSTQTKSTSRIMDWLPRTAHSLKFILDAIDKMPLDHGQKEETGWSTGNSDTTDDATGAST
ncbi:hypothetical protein AWZ03_008187 [Drosophila navojoa]|uniref:Uncharacterized protein n=2 Tax=Drosophila navojoa TaxID=7232 RepID=A0A484BC77_DRONA|nr:hypothetical protein AWZ03_008187 [Drosophila navojoa]